MIYDSEAETSEIPALDATTPMPVIRHSHRRPRRHRQRRNMPLDIAALLVASVVLLGTGVALHVRSADDPVQPKAVLPPSAAPVPTPSPTRMPLPSPTIAVVTPPVERPVVQTPTMGLAADSAPLKPSRTPIFIPSPVQPSETPSSPSPSPQPTTPSPAESPSPSTSPSPSPSPSVTDSPTVPLDTTSPTPSPTVSPSSDPSTPVPIVSISVGLPLGL